MSLREGALSVRFTGGVETKTDPKAVPSVKLLALENAVFRRATSLQKRYGYEALSQTVDSLSTLVNNAIRLASRDDELLAFTPTKCYSRQSGSNQWSDAGVVMSVVGSDRSLVRTGTQQTMPDAATLSGVTVAAWEDSAGGVWWSVVDSVSGRIFRAPTQADAAGQAPRCVAVGANLHIYYASPATRRIMVIVVNPAAPGSAVVPAVLVDDLDDTNPVYDAVPTTRSGTPAAIVWLQHASTTIRVGYVDASGALAGPLTGSPSVFSIDVALLATSPLGIAYRNVNGSTGDVLAVAYVEGGLLATKVTYFSGGSSSVAIAATTTATGSVTVSVQRVAIVFVGAVAWTGWEEAAAAASNRFVTVVSFSSFTATATLTIRSVGLASRAFAVSSDAFAVFVHDTTFFNTYVTLRLSDALLVGRHVPGSAAGAPTRHHLSSVHVVGSLASVALPFRERLTSENNDKFRETGIRHFDLDFDNEASHQTAQLGRGLYMAGACPQHYDGRAWTEHGFHFGPELVATTNSTGGSLTTSTTYEYRYWYEWTDAQGEVHRGPTSTGTLVTMGGSDTQVRHTLPTLRVTSKANVRIGIARSLAAKTGRTAQLFRVTSLDPSTVGAVNGYVASSTSIDTVLFYDQMSDATLATQEELYTDGGILSNDPSALGSVIARGQSRLFFTDPGDGNVIRFSQPLDDGYGVEIPPDLTIRVDPFGGDVTALAFQDGRGIVFKSGAIFTFQGDGPLPNGDTATTGFSSPQLITSDVGCTNPASIVLTPAGHMFQSAKGIYLLERSGQVSYVGAPVEAYNAQAIARASVMPDRTQIVFLTDAGTTLLYDYLFGQWSTFTNHEGLDAAVVSGTYHYLRADGRVFREAIGAYSDAGTRIRVRIETAWIHMQEQLQGFQRFWHAHILGTWQSPHQLGIQYRTDYSLGWTDSYWLDATGLSSSSGWITGLGAAAIGVDPITGSNYGDANYGDGNYGGTLPDIYEWRLHLNEKGKSIQFRFEDFEAVGYLGASFELTELLITGGIKGNAQRPAIAARST